MRDAASRGFCVASRVPYGFSKVMVKDGAKKRPTLEPDPATAPVVERIFDMAEEGRPSSTSPRPSTTRASPTPLAGCQGRSDIDIVRA